MNINRQGDVNIASSLFCALTRSAGGCARRSDGGGLDLAGGRPDTDVAMKVQLATSVVHYCSTFHDNTHLCTTIYGYVQYLANRWKTSGSFSSKVL